MYMYIYMKHSDDLFSTPCSSQQKLALRTEPSNVTGIFVCAGIIMHAHVYKAKLTVEYKMYI